VIKYSLTQLYFPFENLQRDVSALRSRLQAKYKTVCVRVCVCVYIYIYTLQCRKMDDISFTLSYLIIN